jgi:hypothetical protein
METFQQFGLGLINLAFGLLILSVPVALCAWAYGLVKESQHADAETQVMLQDVEDRIRVRQEIYRNCQKEKKDV